ncbi:MAG: trypsin-like peptidase domain-containing protein, partial [Saprospiraceae bacterium]|nr:trypsin-like peptidase domain-containing protein [Saprospiraceae bacterium]
ITLGIYKNFIEQPFSPVRDVLVQDPNYAKLVGHPDFFHPNITNVTSFKEAADLVRPSVVHIHSSSGDKYEKLFGGEASGSGVIISEDGYIVTNNHVIADSKEVTVTLNNKRTYSAKIIGTDRTTDLAVIKIKEKELKDLKLPALKFGNSDEVFVGEWVLAVGNPFNLTSTVTAGIVSAKGRNIDILDGTYDIESFIQTDAVVNPGNSGGALVDAAGNLVGINTAIITRSGRYEGYSFAVPSNLVRKVIKDLRDYGLVQRGMLGVFIDNMTSERAKELGLKAIEGIYVTRVTPDSGADDAGLRKGDVIVGINGTKTKTVPEMQEQVGRYRPGNTISVEYMRDGKKESAKVTLKNKSNNTTLIASNEEDWLKNIGIELQDLSEEDLERIGKHGVRVLSIYRGSKIERTNMEPGFIITKVGETKIKNIKEFIETIKEIEGKVMLEGFYENYPGEYYYAFALDS